MEEVLPLAVHIIYSPHHSNEKNVCINSVCNWLQFKHTCGYACVQTGIHSHTNPHRHTNYWLQRLETW